MGFIHDASAAPRPSALSVLRKGEALGFALAAFLLSLAVTVPTLGRQSLWYDEVLTANVVATGWSDLIADRLGRGHFPTYFMLLKSLGLGGASEAMLRLPSALFMSLAAAVMTVLALRLGGRIAALATLLLFAFMPALVYYGQEARPYAMLLFFLAIATMPLVSLVRGTGEPKRLATAATIGTVGAALAIPAGIASVLIMHLSLILSGALRLPSRFRRPLKLHVAVTWIVIGLAALTLVQAVRTISGERGGLMKWQYATGPAARIAEAWGETYGFRVNSDIDRFLPVGWEVLPSLVFCALVLVAIVIRRRDPAIRLLAGSAIGTPLVFLVLGIFTATAGRYMLGMLPPAIVLAGVGAAEVLGRPKLRRPAALVLGAALLVLGLQALDATQSDSRFDWRSVGRFMAENDVRDVEILTNNSVAPISVGYYLPPGSEIRWQVARPPFQEIDDLWQWARESETAWLLLFFRGGEVPDQVVAGRSVCRFPFGLADLVILTADPTTLPAPLRGCAGN
ncbi:MAG: glycosyltransferase family 39 protein [Bosea sp.]|nr:glycosyltransferase family 39 protein [Bosea sp. (in: a-proteobacteria)]